MKIPREFAAGSREKLEIQPPGGSRARNPGFGVYENKNSLGIFILVQGQMTLHENGNFGARLRPVPGPGWARAWSRLGMSLVQVGHVPGPGWGLPWSRIGNLKDMLGPWDPFELGRQIFETEALNQRILSDNKIASTMWHSQHEALPAIPSGERAIVRTLGNLCGHRCRCRPPCKQPP